jgi:hypothetical protein
MPQLITANDEGDGAWVVAEDAVAEAVEDAVAPLRRALAILQARVDELERRPQAVTPATPPAPARVLSIVPPPSAEPVVAAPPVEAPPLALDDLELALDGSRRRRHAITAFAVLVVIVFGGLFGALATSYG